MIAARDDDYERNRACALIFAHPEMQKNTKSVRSAFQQLLSLRAGAEVSAMGAMHSQQKYQTYSDKVEAHKKPLFEELKGYADKNGVPLPSYVWNAINCTNSANKKWVVSPIQSSWKKHAVTVGLLRNHVLPAWTDILGNKPLPSGIAFDEMFDRFIQLLGMKKEPRPGN
jgi:hypothetical protein